MANIYQVGDGVRLRAEFRATGTFTDPLIVTFWTRDPSKNVDTYNYTSGTVSKISDGIFILDIFADEPGQWWYEVFGTGTVVAADENYFLVERSVIP